MTEELSSFLDAPILSQGTNQTRRSKCRCAKREAHRSHTEALGSSAPSNGQERKQGSEDEMRIKELLPPMHRE
jgi:hypothetical protein